jgi:hypothetical protein
MKDARDGEILPFMVPVWSIDSILSRVFDLREVCSSWFRDNSKDIGFSCVSTKQISFKKRQPANTGPLSTNCTISSTP